MKKTFAGIGDCCFRWQCVPPDQSGVMPTWTGIQTASTVLSQIMSAPDRAIPDSIMSGAKCIAIMPSMLKASFVFGANYGKGVATCRTETAGARRHSSS